jgi:hypothetical protein
MSQGVVYRQRCLPEALSTGSARRTATHAVSVTSGAHP